MHECGQVGSRNLSESRLGMDMWRMMGDKCITGRWITMLNAPNERLKCEMKDSIVFFRLRSRIHLFDFECAINCRQVPSQPNQPGRTCWIIKLGKCMQNLSSFPLFHISHLLFFFILKIEFIKCPGAEILAIRMYHDYFNFSRNEIPADRIVFVAEHSFRKYSSSRVQHWHHWLHGLCRDSELRCIFRKSA